MKLEKIAKVIEFITVQVIPFADLIINSIKKWKSKKNDVPNCEN